MPILTTPLDTCCEMANIELQAVLKKRPSMMTILKLEHTDTETLLLCDLNSIVVWLSGALAGDKYCDLDGLSVKVTAFVQALRHIGIEPVFFCNTLVSFSNKDEFQFILPQTKLEYLDSLDPKKRSRHDLYQKYALFCTNPLMVVQLQMLFESLNVRAVYVLGNFMAEVATYVTKNNAIGILSYNPEFAIFQNVLFIHIDFFDLEKDIDICSKQPVVTPNEIICACIDLEMLSDEFGLTRAGLIDLAIILGNGFSLHLNEKYCIAKYLQIYGKGFESVVTFVRGYQSPVFDSCSKLSYFCDLYKEYSYAVSQSLALYNDPTLFNVIANNDCIISKWVKEKVVVGLLPSYFYALVDFGVFIRQPFYEDHSICNRKIHEKVLFLRKIVYFLLGIDTLQEYGYNQKKPFAVTKVELKILSTPVDTVSRLNNIWYLSLASKCELLASLSLSMYSDKLNDTYVNSVISNCVNKQHEPAVLVDYWIVATSLYVFCQNGGFDGHVFDAIYVSVLIFLSGIDLTIPNHILGNVPSDTNAVNAFSYILQLLYDLSMLLGLGKNLPLPSNVYNPSLSFKVLLLSASLICNSCEKYFAGTVKKLFCVSSVRLFRLKCIDSVQNLNNQFELISLFNSAILELKNESDIIEAIVAELVCKRKSVVPQNETGNSSQYKETCKSLRNPSVNISTGSNNTCSSTITTESTLDHPNSVTSHTDDVDSNATISDDVNDDKTGKL